jgi:VCBS repeat-containing protein
MATFTVTNLNDSGSGSLRAAVALANAAADADTIQFQAGLTGTISLVGELSLTHDVTIDGDTNTDDKADIVLSGRDLNRVFNLSGAIHTTLLSLTLTGGNAGASLGGGAIRSINSGATIDLIDSTIASCTAHSGGGIYAFGSLRLINSTLTDNSANSDGGGILFGGSALLIVNSTISGNTAAAYGGAIRATDNGSLSIFNSTITGNSHSSASTLAGGISLYHGSVLTISNSVVAQNTGGTNPDISENGTNTITATNNFFGSSSGLVLDTDTNNGFGNAMLGALADNGGTVKTHAILAGSPLIGAGDASVRPADTFDLDGDSNTTEPLPLDATGSARVNGNLDIGAVEADFDLVVTTAGDDSVGASLAADRTDGGGLSLREAIAWAASDAKIGFDESVLGSTIVLQTELELSKDITIDGDMALDGVRDGKADVTISGDSNHDGTGNVRIFKISGAGTEVALHSLTLEGGFDAASGGAIWTDSGTELTVVNSTIRDSDSDRGAGIFTFGNLTVVNSTIHGNAATSFAGGVYVAGTTARFYNATLTGNTSFSGGAIDTLAGSQLVITNSTITGNHATGAAGGIDMYSTLGNITTATIRNSIVSGNTSDGSGPDIWDAYGSSLPGTINATNSLLGTGIVVDIGGANIRSNAPLLGTLQDNGGPVLTMRPLDGSPAIGAGTNSDIGSDFFDLDGDGNTTEPTPIDSRGAQRIVGTVDIGAVETLATNDTNGGNAVTENTDPTATGNVLTNDANGHVFGFRAGAESAGGGLSNGTIAGIYGSLTLATNGAWTYSLNNADPDTNALAAGAVVTDKFTYGMQSGSLSDLFDRAELVITITGANDAPVITSNGGGDVAFINVAENTTAVTTVTSTDVDGPARTYSITGGFDMDKFHIDTTTGVLTFITVPDFEVPTDFAVPAGTGNNVYGVNVTVSDGTLTDTQAMAVTVTNVAGHTIKGHKTNADTIDGTNPIGNAATGEEDKINGRGGNDTIKALGGNDSVKGGAGVDNLNGGTGLDTADFSDQSKGVVLKLNGGKAVVATIGGVADDTLKAFENINGGKSNDTLTGDKKANTLSGNNGDDQLDGGKGGDMLLGGKGNDTVAGGLGMDTLTGGADKDVFVFNTKLGATNVDIIADFVHDTDKIQLDSAIFSAIGPTLEAGELFAKAGAVKAKQADDRLIYNTTTGDLYLDKDGKGGDAAVLFATLITKPLFDSGDVVIV